MTILRTAAILALAGVLVSTSLALAGNSNPLGGSPHLGPLTSGPIDAAPGYDPPGHGFGPGDGRPIFSADLVKVSPYALTCRINANGWVWFKNVGTETIPAGSSLTVKWADGTTTTFTVPADIKPGSGVDISEQPGVDYSRGLHCSAKITLSESGGGK